MPLSERKAKPNPVFRMLRTAAGFLLPVSPENSPTYSYARIEVLADSVTVAAMDGIKLYMAGLKCEEPNDPCWAGYFDREGIFELKPDATMDEIREAAKPQNDVSAYRVDLIQQQILAVSEPYPISFAIRRSFLSDVGALFQGMAEQHSNEIPAVVSIAWNTSEVYLALFFQGREIGSKFYPVVRATGSGTVAFDADTLALIARSLTGEEVQVYVDPTHKRPALFKSEGRTVLAVAIPPRSL